LPDATAITWRMPSIRSAQVGGGGGAGEAVASTVWTLTSWSVISGCSSSARSTSCLISRGISGREASTDSTTVT
jgi:hypothetical protein